MGIFAKKTFAEVADEYMTAHKSELRPTSYASYLHLLRRRIIPAVGGIKVRAFTNP